MIRIGNIGLSLLTGAVPATLDDFSIVVDAPGSGLLLTLPASPHVTWSIDGAVSKDNEPLSVLLDPATDFVSGSVSLALPWATDPGSPHPSRRAGFALVAGPIKPPTPGATPAHCRTWTSSLSDKIVAPEGSGTLCIVSLDPRDSLAAPAWMKKELNSHLSFGDAEVHSSFFASRADRFVLKAASGAAARLGFVYDRMKGDQSMMSTGAVVFHPEGSFNIVGPAAAATSDLNILSRDLIAGAAATEFFDLSGATQVKFVKRQPAFLREDETNIPSPVDRSPPRGPGQRGLYFLPGIPEGRRYGCSLPLTGRRNATL